MNILFSLLLVATMAAGLLPHQSRLADDEEDAWSDYVGATCDSLGDVAEAGNSSIGITTDQHLLLQCKKHLYKAEWVQADPVFTTPESSSRP